MREVEQRSRTLNFGKLLPLVQSQQTRWVPSFFSYGQLQVLFPLQCTPMNLGWKTRVNSICLAIFVQKRLLPLQIDASYSECKQGDALGKARRVNTCRPRQRVSLWEINLDLFREIMRHNDGYSVAMVAFQYAGAFPPSGCQRAQSFDLGKIKRINVRHKQVSGPRRSAAVCPSMSLY